MSSNPATLAASRAMLSRNNSVQSNLSAAAAATALKRASIQTSQDLSLQRLPSSSSNLGITSPTSPRPGLCRRTSSMSERSFRTQAPEDHARERRDRLASLMNVTPEKTVDRKPKRRGSFTLPITLRSKSEQKKQKQIAPGVIQPIPQEKTISAAPSTYRGGQLQKLKTSMRGDREGLWERERDRPMSPITHSAMRLPHNPGIGSAASSIRSIHTDLSSIAEDQALGDYGHANPKLPSHSFPIKSAMKGGSRPPSIISEAVSEESRSSLGAQDSQKQKGRVSFSDEQEGNQFVNGVGTGVGKGTKDEFLKPQDAVFMGRRLAPPASPPISPEASPRVPTVGPPMPTPSATQPISPIKKEVVSVEKLDPVEQSNELEMKEIKSNEPTSMLVPVQSKTIAHNVRNSPQITIHVSPSKSLPPKACLPGSFPDPTPEPTPPSTAESDIADAREMTDILFPLPISDQTNAVQTNNMDPQRRSLLKPLALVPARHGVTTPTKLSGGENMVRGVSNESEGSGVSVYSDALDDLLSEQRESTRQTKAAQQKDKQVNGSKTTTATAIAEIPTTTGVIAATTTTKPMSPKSPKKAKRATSMPPAAKRTAQSSISKNSGTNILAKTRMRGSLREDGAIATRTTQRSSSVPPTSQTTSSVPPTSQTTSSSRYRKPMRMSLRETDRPTRAPDMTRGLMSLPRIERVPSDSSFKRVKPKEQSVNRMTLRSPPKQEQPRRLRRDSDSSSEIYVRNRSSSMFGRFKKVSIPPAKQVTAGSRFQDSSDEDNELAPPSRGVGGAYGDTESLPPTSPTFPKHGSFSQFFARATRSTSRGNDIIPPPVVQPSGTIVDTAADGGRRRSKSGSIISKRTGKEKRFQGLRKLFRIKE